MTDSQMMRTRGRARGGHNLGPWATMLQLPFLVLVAMVTCVSSVEKLRIGVVPNWWQLVSSAQNHTNSMMSDAFILIDLDPGPARSAYDRIEKTFRSVKNGSVHAVIGQFDSAYHLATESLKIPYLSTTGVPKGGHNDYTFQVIPEMKWSASAILDIVQAYKWSKVSVFYDDDKGVQVIEKLMTNHSLTVRAWRFPSSNRTPQLQRQLIRDALVEMRKVLVEKSVVLCSKENVITLLDQ
ncbi:unnamed protein product, partial [Lymnaea stagnalis]